MRKKLQPPVEDWIEAGSKLGATLPEADTRAHTNGTTNGVHDTLGAEEMENLWDWAGPEANRVAREIGDEAFADVFTLAEQEDGIENVVTGLRRKFWESDDEDEDGEKEDAMDVDPRQDVPETVRGMQRDVDEGRAMLSLEMVLRYTNTGTLPPGSSLGLS